jgi:hypothetical protein
MRKYKNKIRSGIFMIAALLIGCIYSDSFQYGQEKHILIYDKEIIAQDTGWSGEQMKNFRVPVWDTLSLAGREQVGAVDAGDTVRVLRKTKYGYQVVTSDTGAIGWINKIYVKREFTIDKVQSPPPAYPVDTEPLVRSKNDASDPLIKQKKTSVTFVEHSHEQDLVRPKPIN